MDNTVAVKRCASNVNGESVKGCVLDADDELMLSLSNIRFTTVERRRPKKFMQGRILSIDLGSKRVGIAVSDELRISARPLRALARTSWKRLCAELLALCEELDVKLVVLGLPLHLDGHEGDAAIEAKRIGRNLSLSLNIPVEFQDERFTTKEAEAKLKRNGLRYERFAEHVDSESALIILNDFLSRQT